MEFCELMEAYLDCRKSKRYTREALAFEVDCERNLMELYRELTTGTYRIGPSVVFVVTQPVKREVFAAGFRDRIVQHLVILKLNPLFEKEFIYDSYACRKTKGTLFGVKRVRRFIARCSEGYTKDCYVLKCDIKGFFMNIDRTILSRMAERFISEKYHGGDKELILQLVRTIVMHDPTAHCRVNSIPRLWDNLPPDKSIFTNNGLPMPNGFLPEEYTLKSIPKGIPIGNLTSQILANLYLNGMDHYIKHQLGEKYYGRYMDDFIIVHRSREHLQELTETIRRFLLDNLKLQLHPKKVSISHYSKSVKFLGVDIRKAVLLPGKRVKAGMYRVLYRYNNLARERELSFTEQDAFRQSMNSYLGLMVHYQSFKLRKKAFEKFSPELRRYAYGQRYGKVALKKKKPLPALWDDAPLRSGYFETSMGGGAQHNERPRGRKLLFLWAWALTAALSSCQKDDLPPPEAPVTRVVFAYMGGDNDLTFEVAQKMDALAQGFGAAAGKGDRLLVFHDVNGEEPSLTEMRSAAGAGMVQTRLLKTYDGYDSADGATLAAAADDVRGLYPGASFGLVIFSHASGWLPEGMYLNPLLPPAVAALYTGHYDAPALEGNTARTQAALPAGTAAWTQAASPTGHYDDPALEGNAAWAQTALPEGNAAWAQAASLAGTASPAQTSSALRSILRDGENEMGASRPTGHYDAPALVGNTAWTQAASPAQTVSLAGTAPLAAAVLPAQAAPPAQTASLAQTASASPAQTSSASRSILRDGENEMEIAELAAALPGGMFDWIVFETCFMAGVEVAYELRDKAPVILASSAEIVSPGFTPVYPDCAGYLLDGDMEGFARSAFGLADGSTGWRRSATYSVIRTAGLQALKDFIDAHADFSAEVDVFGVQRFDRNVYRLFFDMEDYYGRLLATDALRSELSRLIGQCVPWKAATPEFMTGHGGFEIERHCGLTTYIRQPEFTRLNEAYDRLAWKR